MKAILVLLDSLNRHLLPVYGNTWVKTPNIDRFAGRSIVFDNHWIGSAPCIPACGDILTGRLSLLESDWGGVEPFDVPFPRILREHGVLCHMYAHASRASGSARQKHLGQRSAQYGKDRSLWDFCAGFSAPSTFSSAVDWLRCSPGADDCFLWIEAGDPLEPFDCPREFLDMYRDCWDGPLHEWRGHGRVGVDAEVTTHLRRRYAATLTIVDQWFGELLDEIERQDQMDDSLIILTTDHGYMLGEHGVTGKNPWHAWNEMAHIPLMVHLPGDRGAGERRNQMTQNVDIMPTLLDYFGIRRERPVHGESWLPLVDDRTHAGRLAVLYGWYGRAVNVTDGRYTYFRAPASPHNQPLYRCSLAPGSFGPLDACCDSMLFNVVEDHAQTVDLCATEIEGVYEKLLIETMHRMDASDWQFDRLGLRRR